MFDKQELQKIENARKDWEQGPVKESLKRFGLNENPNQFYTPADLKGWNFLEKVGFPGKYPFTAAPYAINPFQSGLRGAGPIAQSSATRRSGRYSGYGCAEDSRDYYKEMQRIGQTVGPNLAFDLPTQCGYDSDAPEARGEVGRVGVAISTLRDFEVIYEAFKGELDLDKIASNYTINGPTNIIIAMLIALADKRGIPRDKLVATPQNDILKEFVARGTYIFPPKPSMRMFRDSMVYFTKNLPRINICSIGGYHIREAGATREQDLAFSMAIGIAYLQTGVDAGLDIDSFAPRFSFNAFGGSMEFFKEIAFQRAARRTWARVLKERLGARSERSMLLRQPLYAHMGNVNATVQRPLNNLTRSVVGAIASAVVGGPTYSYPPYDEPLGLGWSLEAAQLAEDCGRILQLESHLTEVIDPMAGSYYVESLTDQIDDGAAAELKRIDEMGGAIAAIESGYMHRQIAKSAFERRMRIEKEEEYIVGVNCFTGENELEVTTSRVVPHPYDPVRREQAEEKQIANLKKVKKDRDNRKVQSVLKQLQEEAKDESANLMPTIIEAVKAYASLGEICGTLKTVFGEYRPPSL